VVERLKQQKSRSKGFSIKNAKKENGTAEEGSKLNNIIFGIVAFLTAIIIMAGILLGAFYLLVHNNFNGIADRYRKDIQNMKLLRWVLPEPPDHDDPEYLADDEIRRRYKVIKEERDQLKKELEEAQKLVSELQIYKEGYEKLVQENQESESKLLEEKNELEKKREEIQELAAKGDTNGFKNYYKQMNAELAEKIYREIMLEEKNEADMKKIVKIYESMDEAAAAKIFNDLGEQNIDMIVDILLRLQVDKASAILGEMDSAFASKVTKKMAENLY